MLCRGRSALITLTQTDCPRRDARFCVSTFCSDSFSSTFFLFPNTPHLCYDGRVVPIVGLLRLDPCHGNGDVHVPDWHSSTPPPMSAEEQTMKSAPLLPKSSRPTPKLMAVLLLLTALLIGSAAPLAAAGVPPAQTFYIPMPEDQVLAALRGDLSRRRLGLLRQLCFGCVGAGEHLCLRGRHCGRHGDLL